MSVGQKLILPFILFYPWLSAFPLFGLSCRLAQGLPKSRLAGRFVPHRRPQSEDAFGVLDQAAARGPEHERKQASGGEVGRGLGNGGDGEGGAVPREAGDAAVSEVPRFPRRISS